MARSQPIAIIERVLDDDYFHEQVAAAGAGLRDTYRRARRLPPAVAVQDKTVYDHVRTAAAGITAAARRAAGKPPPEPPRRRRGPLLLVLAAAGAVVAYAAKREREASRAATIPRTGSTPMAAPAAVHMEHTSAGERTEL
jgi:hypothetical protein